jgi:hypothetical protein
MTSGSTILMAVVAVIIICVAVSAASKRPNTAWSDYHFDGTAFVAGPTADGSPFLSVMDRVTPVVQTRAVTAKPVALPSGYGALAGICYIQSSGGKLGNGCGFAPCSGLPLTITSGTRVVMDVVSDDNGYFVAVLAAGSYRIGNGAFSAEATVKAGTTTLAALRTGKRMTD